MKDIHDGTPMFTLLCATPLFNDGTSLIWSSTYTVGRRLVGKPRDTVDPWFYAIRSDNNDPSIQLARDPQVISFCRADWDAIVGLHHGLMQLICVDPEAAVATSDWFAQNDKGYVVVPMMFCGVDWSLLERVTSKVAFWRQLGLFL
ncbi:Aste57867_15872 [Aphanomyces stellatus]|uniref:Aste57867_15872 protein n=1 Tax=Aphanomyces stellatus TaxID=120398 RepID=A0A485L566_9STRA|nr:hypothetical protein As57867_015816 [Aphanomyces stellatus]VFT92659.1 Aste57867_15872 [Aphanomyces stellatus]